MNSKKIRIAYLVLCHTDPEHIRKLVDRLSMHADVYVHVDKRSEIDPFLLKNPNVMYLEHRFHPAWGGYHAVLAIIELMRTAMNNQKYDRFVLIQGLDYPIKTDSEILKFYEENRDTEFVRACKITGSTDPFFYRRTKCKWYHDTPNPFLKVWNRINLRMGKPVCLRQDHVLDNSVDYDIYWGSAQFAITNECAKYIVHFHDEHAAFREYMKHSFPVDELYFNTIIMNSDFAKKTSHGGPEPCRKMLSSYRNLHFFTYPTTVYDENDYELLMKQPELYCRKITSEKSAQLVKKLDEQNEQDKSI